MGVNTPLKQTLRVWSGYHPATISLLWNSAIQAVFKQFFGAVEGIVAMLTYAVVVTIIAVIITVNVAKVSENVLKKEQKLEKLKKK